MNKFGVLSLAVALSAAAAWSPAYAQDALRVTLRVNSGSVMTSQGGEYVPAQPGQILGNGDRVMVMEGGSADMLFNCVREFSQPGEHIVPGDCNGVETWDVDGDGVSEATLRMEGSGITTSQQGVEYVPGQQGQALIEGERVKVMQGSSATALYSCVKPLRQPGVYDVDDDCGGAAAVATIPAESDTPLVVAGIAGLVAVGLAVGSGGGGGGSNDRPSSP